MEKNVGKYNKATLIAAALIITGSTAIFGTYASGYNEDSLAPTNPFSCSAEVNQLNDEQKTKIQQAHELSDAGDKEGAKKTLNGLGIKPPMPRWIERTEELNEI